MPGFASPQKKPRAATVSSGLLRKPQSAPAKTQVAASTGLKADFSKIPATTKAAATSIAADVRKLLAVFEAENPKLKGKAYLTSGSRAWQVQLDIILNPKRKNNYKNIKRRFLAAFKLKVLPTNRKSLTAPQLNWWNVEIMKQAGKTPGFPHVGGKAQDVSVRNLDDAGKAMLKAKFETKFGVLMEKVTGTTSKYGVSLSDANVFHVYSK